MPSGLVGAMKYPVRRFRSLAVALRELERFVRDGQLLRTGRPSKAFLGMLPREIWANWLLCATINGTTGRDDLEFTTDPLGGDGIICDVPNERTWATEHVFVPPVRAGELASVEEQILRYINAKNDRGSAYARGKTLVVFVDAGGGVWFPNQVLRSLPDPLHFHAAWLISLHGVGEDGSYNYDISGLYLDGAGAPVWRIRIEPDFQSWSVVRVQ